MSAGVRVDAAVLAKTGEAAKAGPIGLQLHSNAVPQEVRFKGLVLETFPKEDRLLTVK